MGRPLRTGQRHFGVLSLLRQAAHRFILPANKGPRPIRREAETAQRDSRGVITPVTVWWRNNEAQQAASARIQVIRRADRLPYRAWTDRCGRPERLRQVESCRGATLGYGRDLAQVPARVRAG